MGYTTDFFGKFSVTPTLAPNHREYLRMFAETRRMKRNATKTATRPDPIREAVGLPIGTEGGYFVGETGYSGQDNGKDVIEFNYPPKGQPGLWCQWIPSEDGMFLQWDEGEKFYDYIEWLQYLIDNFLTRWDYVLNGEVRWEGEDRHDEGKIVVKDNKITIY